MMVLGAERCVCDVDMFMPEVLATEVVAGASLVVQPCERPVGVAEGARLMLWTRLVQIVFLTGVTWGIGAAVWMLWHEWKEW